MAAPAEKHAFYLATIGGADYAALRVGLCPRSVAHVVLGVRDRDIEEDPDSYCLGVELYEFSTKGDRDKAMGVAAAVGALIDYDHAKTRAYKVFDAGEVDAIAAEIAAARRAAGKALVYSDSSEEEDA